MRLPALPRSLRRFARSGDGAVTVELVVFTPVLIMTLLSMASFYDILNARNASLRAGITVADAFSRQAEVTDEFIAEMDALYAFLTDRRGDTGYRISVVRMVSVDTDGDAEPDDEELVLQWSDPSNAKTASLGSVSEIAAHVPTMAVGREAIVVETWNQWRPVIFARMGNRTFAETIVLPPRFYATLKREGLEEPPTGDENGGEEVDA